MKILNLYAGIGGNRKLWGNEHEVTAVEFDKDIALTYKKFFPNDNVIVADAHQFLLEHYEEFDFIWSSPPCPSHSRVRCANVKQNKPIYADMKLYEEIILLQKWFKGKFVVENVKPYYKPLIEAQECGRHLFWANFKIENKTFKSDIGGNAFNSNTELIALKKGVSNDFKIKNKIKVLRNCVQAELGLHILQQITQ